MQTYLFVIRVPRYAVDSVPACISTVTATTALFAVIGALYAAATCWLVGDETTPSIVTPVILVAVLAVAQATAIAAGHDAVLNGKQTLHTAAFAAVAFIATALVRRWTDTLYAAVTYVNGHLPEVLAPHPDAGWHRHQLAALAFAADLHAIATACVAIALRVHTACTPTLTTRTLSVYTWTARTATMAGLYVVYRGFAYSVTYVVIVAVSLVLRIIMAPTRGMHVSTTRRVLGVVSAVLLVVADAGDASQFAPVFPLLVGLHCVSATANIPLPAITASAVWALRTIRAPAHTAVIQTHVARALLVTVASGGCLLVAAALAIEHMLTAASVAGGLGAGILVLSAIPSPPVTPRPRPASSGPSTSRAVATIIVLCIVALAVTRMHQTPPVPDPEPEPEPEQLQYPQTPANFSTLSTDELLRTQPSAGAGISVADIWDAFAARSTPVNDTLALLRRIRASHEFLLAQGRPQSLISFEGASTALVTAATAAVAANSRGSGADDAVLLRFVRMFVQDERGYAFACAPPPPVDGAVALPFDADNLVCIDDSGARIDELPLFIIRATAVYDDGKTVFTLDTDGANATTAAEIKRQDAPPPRVSVRDGLTTLVTLFTITMLVTYASMMPVVLV